MTEHDNETIAPEEQGVVVELEDLGAALEAVLMVAEEPIDATMLAQASGHPVDVVQSELERLSAQYLELGRGFELRELGGGWRFYSRVEFDDVVRGFVLEGQQSRLSQAALETLAVVAYRQPVSRSRISAIRGVNVDGVVRTLVTRGLIEEAGTDVSSGAILYQTTSYFLERMGMSSLEELPALAPLLPELDDLDMELERVAGRVTESGSAQLTEEDVADDFGEDEVDGG